MKEIIEEAFENRSNITPRNSTLLVRDAVNEAIELLDSGRERVAQKEILYSDEFSGRPEEQGDWIVNDWLKKAILLSSRVNYADYDINDFNKDEVRIVPPAVARKGSYLASGIMLMSSFVDIGAYVDKGTTIDTLATVGSCAQIGKNVHLSSDVSIGGMLESIETKPTIIEDNCFIGAGSKITEGVIVEEGSVISMGVHIDQNTKIYNSTTKEVTYGRIPAGSVVVSGTLPSEDGRYSLHCAVIVKQVDAGTLSETELSKLLSEVS